MASRLNRKIPKNQLAMSQLAKRKFSREAVPGLQPDEVARKTQMRRLKKSSHTIYRTTGSAAKHVKRLHPRKGE
jgi:hypothetical protein